MAYSTKFSLGILRLENCRLQSQDKCYIAVAIGDQAFTTHPFPLCEAVVNQHFILSTTESHGKLQLFKKSLIGADSLMGEGSFPLNLSQFGPVYCEVSDHNTSDYIALAKLQLKVEAFPSIVNSLIPEHHNLSPTRMTENFRGFVLNISFIVHFYNKLLDIYTWKNPAESGLVVLGIYGLWMNFSYLPVVLIISLWLWIVYYAVYKTPTEGDSNKEYIENLAFIQESMGALNSLTEAIANWKEDTIYWKDKGRSKSMLRLLEISLLPVFFLCFSYNFFNLVWVLLMLLVLSGSPFCQVAAMFAYGRLRALLGGSSKDVAESQGSPIGSPQKKVYRVYENERMWLGKWTGYTFPTERDNWSDVNGKNLKKERVGLPEKFEWLDDWMLEKPEQDSWEYAPDFTKKFHTRREKWDYVRRRCWVRVAVKKEDE